MLPLYRHVLALLDFMLLSRKEMYGGDDINSNWKSHIRSLKIVKVVSLTTRRGHAVLQFYRSPWLLSLGIIALRDEYSHHWGSMYIHLGYRLINPVVGSLNYVGSALYENKRAYNINVLMPEWLSRHYVIVRRALIYNRRSVRLLEVTCSTPRCWSRLVNIDICFSFVWISPPTGGACK